MSATPLTFQEAWIANLKSKVEIVALSDRFPQEIREAEWQGTDFVYPAIRVSLDFRPTMEGCGPDDATVYIEVFSEQKSSKEAVTIASKIEELYHKRAFIQNGIKFSTVWVKEVSRPVREIYAWVSRIEIFCQGV